MPANLLCILDKEIVNLDILNRCWFSQLLKSTRNSSEEKETILSILPTFPSWMPWTQKQLQLYLSFYSEITQRRTYSPSLRRDHLSSNQKSHYWKRYAFEELGWSKRRFDSQVQHRISWRADLREEEESDWAAETMRWYVYLWHKHWY